MNGLERIFNRVTVMVVCMEKDGETRVYPVDVVRKRQGWIAGPAGAEFPWERAGGDKWRNPVLVVLTGYGIISKVYGLERSGEMERITEGGEFICDCSGCGSGEQRVCFTRREKVAPLLEKLEEVRVPVADVYVAGDGGEGAFCRQDAEEMQNTALFAVERFCRENMVWKKLAEDERRRGVLITLVERRVRLPLLMCLLFLLLVNYMWNGRVREAYNEQEQELTFLERGAASREKLSGKTVRLINEFRGGGQVRFAVLSDRIAALVPTEVTLETLVVNPLLKNIEEKKPPMIRSGYISLTGVSADPEKVTVFTGSLSGCDFARQVQLLSLDRSRESGLFHFSILIRL